MLVTQYQPFTGSLPIMLGGNEPFNAMFKATVVDLFEDIRFTGALRLPLFGGSNATAVSVLVREEPAFLPLSRQVVLFSTVVDNGMHVWII